MTDTLVTFQFNPKDTPSFYCAASPETLRSCMQRLRLKFKGGLEALYEVGSGSSVPIRSNTTISLMTTLGVDMDRIPPIQTETTAIDIATDILLMMETFVGEMAFEVCPMHKGLHLAPFTRSVSFGKPSPMRAYNMTASVVAHRLARSMTLNDLEALACPIDLSQFHQVQAPALTEGGFWSDFDEVNDGPCYATGRMHPSRSSSMVFFEYAVDAKRLAEFQNEGWLRLGEVRQEFEHSFETLMDPERLRDICQQCGLKFQILRHVDVIFRAPSPTIDVILHDRTVMTRTAEHLALLTLAGDHTSPF